MSDRQEVEARLLVDGRPTVVRLINNPTIEDVVVTEMRLQAARIEGIAVPERRVERDIRDFLIRLGVER